MPTKIIDLTVHDVRFPTSRALDGSDAMNPAPDYSATYVVLKTNSPQGLAGHGLTFTIGRGNELCVTAIGELRGRTARRGTSANPCFVALTPASIRSALRSRPISVFGCETQGSYTLPANIQRLCERPIGTPKVSRKRPLIRRIFESNNPLIWRAINHNES